MSDSFLASIVARGEGLQYSDEEGACGCEIGRRGNTVELHAYQFEFGGAKLNAVQCARVIPRIVTFLEKDGSKVVVLNEPPPHPLR